MKKKLNFTLLTLVVLSGILLFACRKEEQPEMNAAADPCACASEVTADFDILEHLRNGVADHLNVFTLTDDVLANKRASFRAKIDDAEYTWYIGLDVENDKEINRYFSDQWIGQNIPITLVVKKEPNKTCFPDDDGYDSITKIMHVYDRCDTNHLEGDFRIAQVGTVDSFDVKLDIRGRFDNNVFDPTVCAGLDFYNYDQQGGECVMNTNFEIIRNYRFFKISNQPNSNCTAIYINSCELDMDNNFSFHYQYIDENSNNITLITKGRKL